LTKILQYGGMPNYRRMYRPGGTYFFTVTLAERGSRLLVERIDDFRAAYGAVVSELPVRTEAIVVMPDHIHAVWTLPEGDADYSTRWKKIKTRFSWAVRDGENGGGNGGANGGGNGGGNGGLSPTLRVSASKRAKGEVGVWQRRFWEHMIRDEDDFAAHVHYCHVNPVKHGFVEYPQDWPYSSVHREMRRP
jgi:putative transposase